MASIIVTNLNRYRGVVLWALRAVALTLVATGTYLVLKRVLYGAASGNVSEVIRLHTGDLGESESFYRGLAMVAVGAAMAGLSRRLSRWVIAIPPTGCPRCGHPRGPGAAGSRCTECGLDLSGTLPADHG